MTKERKRDEEDESFVIAAFSVPKGDLCSHYALILKSLHTVSATRAEGRYHKPLDTLARIVSNDL